MLCVSSTIYVFLPRMSMKSISQSVSIPLLDRISIPFFCPPHCKTPDITFQLFYLIAAILYQYLFSWSLTQRMHSSEIRKYLKIMSRISHLFFLWFLFLWELDPSSLDTLEVLTYSFCLPSSETEACSGLLLSDLLLLLLLRIGKFPQGGKKKNKTELYVELTSMPLSSNWGLGL